MAERLVGTVKWFDATKGYGFISPESGSKDIFVHQSALPMDLRDLREGDRVEFEVEAGDKGPKAVGVIRL
jgi:CspA family cold shock protein